MAKSYAVSIIRYFLFVGIPYLIARRIEKYFWEHASPELKEACGKGKKTKDFPKLDTISESTEDSLNTRGGTNPIVFWLGNVIMKDFAIKLGISAVFANHIWLETTENTAAQLAKYGSLMLTAPGKRFIRLHNRIKKGINPEYSQDIQEILIDHELTNTDKVELLKIKIKSALRNLKGAKRKEFILFLIATIAFSVGGDTALFTWLLERLRALIGKDNDVDVIKDYIIEAYREFNAPLSQELVEDLPDEIISSINNIN